MKIKCICLFLFSLPFLAFSQFQSGYIPAESRDMIQLCNSFGFLTLYDDDSSILPEKYKKIFTSESLGMDNKFQVYANESEKKGAICFRGTTKAMTSWMANLYASMIPIDDKIIINDKKFKYQLGEGKTSRVHAGYTLAIYYLKDDLLKQIKQLNEQGIYDIFITGHSQGGALALLVRAYLDYLPESVLSSKNKFKVYAFANPMVGNQAFAKEYYERYEKQGMSYIIHNTEDFITKLPISYNDSTFWKENLVKIMMGNSSFSMSSAALEGLMFAFKDRITEMAKSMSKNIENQLFDQLGEIQMPNYGESVNYSHMKNLIEISPTVYPLVLKDSTILQNDSLMKIYKRDEHGVFENKRLYEKQSMFLQHKTYNYYTAILKDEFPKEYGELEQKYFVMPENAE